MKDTSMTTGILSPQDPLLAPQPGPTANQTRPNKAAALLDLVQAVIFYGILAIGLLTPIVGALYRSLTR